MSKIFFQKHFSNQNNLRTFAAPKTGNVLYKEDWKFKFTLSKVKEQRLMTKDLWLKIKTFIEKTDKQIKIVDGSTTSLKFEIQNLKE